MDRNTGMEMAMEKAKKDCSVVYNARFKYIMIEMGEIVGYSNDLDKVEKWVKAYPEFRSYKNRG